jgi:uncharacterized membrane protein YraQ (UPF0718 family)
LLNLDELSSLIWGRLSLVEKGMIIFTVIVYVLFAAYSPSTREKTANSLVTGTTSLIRISLLLLSGVFLGSLVGTMIPREIIARMLGQESGFRGILFGTLFGAVMPGGPYVLFPVLASLFASGAAIPPMVAMVFAWQTIALSRIPTDLAYLSEVGGQRIIWLRVLLGIPVPLIMGVVAGMITSTVFKT